MRVVRNPVDEPPICLLDFDGEIGVRGGQVAGTNEEVLRAVLQAWCDGLAAAQQAMRTHLTEDCQWEQTGLPTTTGPEEAAQLMGSMEAMGFSSMAVEFRNVAATGD